MPLNLNTCTVAGTLTRDPEVKYTPKGKAVCQLSLAVNETWKDDAGNKHESVSFFEVEAWGRTAEVIGEFCFKGHCILVEGKLKQDTWDDKETQKKRSKVKIICEKMHFVSKPKDSGQESQEEQRAPATRQQSRPAQRPQSPPPRPPVSQDDAEVDDIPFNSIDEDTFKASPVLSIAYAAYNWFAGLNGKAMLQMRHRKAAY